MALKSANWRTSCLVLLPIIAFSGCSDRNESGSRSGTTAIQTSTSTIAWQEDHADLAPANDGGADKAGILLEEVLYLPANEAVAYIELANVTDETVPLEFLTLQVDETLIPLQRAVESLAAGARLLVLFDGPARPDGLKHR